MVIPLLNKLLLDTENKKNFRPVSNLAFACKLVETVAVKRFNSNVNTNDIDVMLQSAYWKGHSEGTVLSESFQWSPLCYWQYKSDTHISLRTFCHIRHSRPWIAHVMAGKQVWDYRYSTGVNMFILMWSLSVCMHWWCWISEAYPRIWCAPRLCPRAIWFPKIFFPCDLHLWQI